MLSLTKNTENSEREMFIVPTLFGERHLNSLPAANVSNITQQNISLGNVAKSLFAGLISNLHKYLNDFILEKKKKNHLFNYYFYCFTV